MLGFGAWLVLKDASVSPGIMVAASIIFGRAIAPLDQSIAASKGFMSGLMAMKRLDALLTRHGGKSQPMPLPKPAGALRVEDLALVPAGSRKPVLQGVKFSLEAGEILAVVGPSASGKSSLARALVGLWPPASGKIRLDGAELAQWEPDALGQYIGYLPQDVELLAGTVKENIARFGEAAADVVLTAADQAGCHELVLNLPDGYDTRIGDGGSRLSGGQSQRVALARCYFGDPALVVLDEPDSNLDVEGVAALDAALARMKARGTTAVLITHNVRLLRHADKALMLTNGGMAYFGPPRELMEKLSRRAA
jgi:PrtD family type I secretion system ABC transporter